MALDRKALVFAASVITVGSAYADKKEYNLVPAGTAKFTLVDPKMPQGPQIAVVSGDPKTGPVTVLLKINKGPSPMHWHTSDYSALLVEGKAKHWLQGSLAADAKENGPGTAWFQPGGTPGTAHGDECMTDTCILFIVMPKKLDFLPAFTTSKTPTKTPPDKK